MISRTVPRAYALVLCALVTATSTSASAETLLEALGQVYTENPSLLAQRMSLRRAQDKRQEASANWRPTVAFSGSEGRRRMTGTIYPPPSVFVLPSQQVDESGETRDLGLSMTQPLYRGGRTVAAIHAAEAGVAGERAKTSAVEQATLQSAASDFFDVLRDEAISVLREEDEKRAQEELNGVSERLRGGALSRTDVAQSAARLARATADRQQAEASLRASSYRYEQVIGHRPGVLQWPETLTLDVPPSLPEAERVLASDNPDIDAAVSTLRAAGYTINEADGELLPTVDLVVNADRRFNVPIELQAPTNKNRLDDLSVLIRFTMSLYEPGTVHSRARQARHEYSEALFKLEAARRAALSKLRADWTSEEAAKSRVGALQEVIRQYQTVLQGSQAQLTGGTRTLRDVLDAERDLIAARVDLENAKHDREVTAINIAAEIGHLTAQDLGVDVSQLEAADGN